MYHPLNTEQTPRFWMHYVRQYGTIMRQTPEQSSDCAVCLKTSRLIHALAVKLTFSIVFFPQTDRFYPQNPAPHCIPELNESGFFLNNGSFWIIQ